MNSLKREGVFLVKITKGKLTNAQIEEKRKKSQKRSFRIKIRNIFNTAGFEYLNTEGKNIKIGRRIVEVDFVLFYKNIILICEDTSTNRDNIKVHIRNKKEAFDEINQNFEVYLKWLKDTFPDKASMLDEYSKSRFKLFYLYFSLEKLSLSEEELDIYAGITFVEPKTLNYFYHMAQCIKRSLRYEIFRFLKLKSSDLGLNISENSCSTIETSIIYPDDSVGLNNGVRVVSFMMSAESLLKTCYVLRKDNWEDTVLLYQRLIDKNKIKKIRNFLVNEKTSFYNNIIVVLPDDVQFYNKDNNNPIDLEDIDQFKSCKMFIPKEMNSICIIDGQHRIFAHYEGNDNDRSEKNISSLRKKLHLLVTGLIFPKEMRDFERLQLQSKIFLDINSNAKSVPPDVLLHIQGLRDPFSDFGISREVINRLNKESIFNDRFEMSSLDKGKIKIASIIKFALKYLVTLEPADGKKSIYNYWTGNKEGIGNLEEDALNEYIKYVVNYLKMYFSAIKKHNNNIWNDSESKILSVTSINGYLIALRRQLTATGMKDFEYYDTCFAKLSKNYSKENFGYTSSQYYMFSTEILKSAFEIDASRYQ